MNELYRRVYNILGEAHMLIMAQEEMSELSKAITKYQRNKIKSVRQIEEFNPSLLEAIAEEVADVEILTEQIKQAYDFFEKVQQYKTQKLERLEERTQGYENKGRRY